MRLFHKIFLCFVVIFSITFQVAGYLLINHTYGNAISQEKKLAFQNFQYNRYILQSSCILIRSSLRRMKRISQVFQGTLPFRLLCMV